MSKITWEKFHLFMIFMLVIISVFWRIFADKKADNIGKDLNNKEKTSVVETIVTAIIIMIVGAIFFFGVLYFIGRSPIIRIGISGIFGMVYTYMAVKQTVKMIFVPEHRAFSASDIENFVYVYLIWVFMMAVISLSKVNTVGEEISSYQEIVKVGILLFQYYFNIFFALGAVYILIFYLSEITKKAADKFKPILKNIRCKLVALGKLDRKYKKLKCLKLWEETYRKNVIYKILMTIPFIICDILQMAYLIIKTSIRLVVVAAIICFLDPVSVLCKYMRKLWNRHKNNEWLYIFAQIAGLCSYAIVFIIIQYGEYVEATKNIYEFVGTIILIPYFQEKIASIKNALKENEF